MFIYSMFLCSYGIAYVYFGKESQDRHIVSKLDLKILNYFCICVPFCKYDCFDFVAIITIGL